MLKLIIRSFGLGLLCSTAAASGQATDRYTRVANQLVELINAGDYSAIQTNFDSQMGAALPLEKSTEFFSGLKQQMGKIQKVGEARPLGEGMLFLVKCENDALDMQLALYDRGRVGGLRFTPHVETKPAPEKHQTQLS